MKTALLLTVASLASVLGTKPEKEVKTEAAAGRYNRPPQYSSYGSPSFDIGYWQPFVQDRFVCDLDASVLLVVDSNRHHHRYPRPYYGEVPSNRAVRVKCSEVATHDEDSCNFCCQQTARRDTTLANSALFGFLAITKTDDDETFKRSKRSADDDDDDSSDDDDDDNDERRHGGQYHRVDATYVSEASWEPETYNTNVKCVCCAPRINPAAQNPSNTYGNINTFVQPQPVSAQAPTGSYSTYSTAQAPPASASSWSATAQAQPFVDSWQQDNSAPAQSWGSASVAPVAAPPAATPLPVASSKTY